MTMVNDLAHDLALKDRTIAELRDGIQRQGAEIDRLCRAMMDIAENQMLLREALVDARMALNVALLADGLSGEIKGRLRTAWLKVGDALTLKTSLDEQGTMSQKGNT